MAFLTSGMGISGERKSWIKKKSIECEWGRTSGMVEWRACLILILILILSSKRSDKTT